MWKAIKDFINRLIEWDEANANDPLSGRSTIFTNPPPKTPRPFKEGGRCKGGVNKPTATPKPSTKPGPSGCKCKCKCKGC